MKRNKYLQTEVGRHNVRELERMHRWVEKGFRDLLEQHKFAQPGSPLALLDSDPVLKTALVPPHQTVLDGLRACQQALAMIHYFAHQGGPLTMAMFDTILRVGTLGAAHVIYMLEPDDHDVRVDRAKELARAENASWFKWYRDWTDPKYRDPAATAGPDLTDPSLKAEQEWNAKYNEQDESLFPRKGQGAPRDGDLWDHLAAVIATSYESDFHTTNDAIRQTKALWNFGSGATHGWGWVWYSHWGNCSPDDLTGQLKTLGVDTHKAFQLAAERSTPTS